MSFAESNSPIDVQRVIRTGWCLGHRTAGGVSKLIRRSHDEGVKGVPRVETGRTSNSRRWHVLLYGWQRTDDTEGPRRLVGLSLRDEIDGEVRPLDLAHRFSDDGCIVFHQPVLEKR